MSKATATENPFNTCACGTCGQSVGPKAIYRPGHDSRHVSVLVAELINTIADGGKVTKQTIAASAKRLPSDALRAKFTRAAERATTPKPAEQADTEAVTE